jgi:type IV pilus assembly protein PilC
MPVFQYSARSETGANQSGAIFAYDEDVLYRSLRGQGLFLLHSRRLNSRALNPKRISLSHKQILALTIHLSTYQQAGIPLMQTLQSLANESSSVKFQAVVDSLITGISSGSSFSEALSQFPRIFDTYYVQMVTIGEATGQLDLRLEELVSYMEWRQEIRSQIKQSSTYPLIIVVLLFLLVTLLMAFTLPKFVALLTQFNTRLPTPTRIVIAVSNAFSKYWFLLPLVSAIPYALCSAIKSTPQGRMRLDRFKLKIPLFGSLQTKIALSRFAHHFGALQAAGIDTLSALKIVEGIVGNLSIGEIIQRARQGVAAGKSLTQLFAQSPEFPPFVIQMLKAGEESGNLEAMLKKVALYYDREIPTAIKKTFAIIEPVILVFIGALVAFIILSILLPIYEFGTSINK